MSFQERRDKLLPRLTDVDAFLVSAPHHVTYLTGFGGDSSYLLMTRDKSILVSDSRYEIQIREECAGLETFIRKHDKTTPQAVAEIVERLGVRNIAIEANYLTVGALGTFEGLVKAASWVPRADWVETLRSIKDEGEIAAIKRSIACAEAAFADFRRNLTPGATEIEMVNRLEFAIRGAGASHSAFDIIVGVGERSALPHCPPTGKRLHEADFLLVDWGAEKGGYKSDLTRVIRSPFAESGRFAAIEKKLHGIYKIVSEAQARAAAAIRPGVDVREVDRAARGYIADAGYGDQFNHGLGHGFGLEIHEAPSIRSNAEGTLQAGMVTTLEPGIYLAGELGVRIEDDYLVTPDGCERLSTLPRDWEFFLG